MFIRLLLVVFGRKLRRTRTIDQSRRDFSDALQIERRTRSITFFISSTNSIFSTTIQIAVDVDRCSLVINFRIDRDLYVTRMISFAIHSQGESSFIFFVRKDRLHVDVRSFRVLQFTSRLRDVVTTRDAERWTNFDRGLRSITDTRCELTFFDRASSFTRSIHGTNGHAYARMVTVYRSTKR